MRFILCLLYRPLLRLFNCIMDRKNILAAVLLTSFVTIFVVQKYKALSNMQYLLENEFSVVHLRPMHDVGAVNGLMMDTNSTSADDEDKIGYFEPSNCPRGIAALPRYSQWFRERFKPDIKLFLDIRDMDNLRNLSFYELPYGFKNENSSLIVNLLHHRNFKNPALRPRKTKDCISCAVVGSGGILNGSLAGKEIDSHDYVFRLNAAVTHGRYAEDVGRRTNFYMFFPESAHFANVQNPSVMLLYTMYKSFDVGYAVKMIQPSGLGWRSNANKERLKIIHPDFFRYVFAKFLDGKSMKPTTGAMVVMTAVHICDSVTIYGFGYDSRFSMHYYDWKFLERTYKSTWTHDVENEKRLWDKLHDEGIIRFFKRDVIV